MHTHAHDIAAQMLNASPGLLHHDLYRLIEHVDSMSIATGGSLRSRQTIATLIAVWQLTHPNEQAVPND